MRPLQRFIPVLIAFSVIMSGCAKDREMPLVKEIRAAEIPSLLLGEGRAVTVVNVWASWCDPCREEIPDLLRLRKTYAPKGVSVLFLSADDREDVDSLVRPLLASLGIDFATYVTGDTADDEFITGMHPEWNGALPATFLYDSTRMMRRMLVGKQSYDALRDAVEQLLPE